MNCCTRIALAVVCACVLVNDARASTIDFNGYLNDPTNTNVVGSDLGAPLFADNYSIANDVAL
jgi:hypothetical protein